MNIDNVLQSHGVGISGNNIKNIQRIVGSTSSGDIINTINPTNVKNSIIMYNAVGGYLECKRIMYVPSFSNISNNLATQVKLTNYGYSHLNSTLNYVIKIIEFNNVMSKQEGTFNPTSFNQTININSININKSTLVVYSNSNLDTISFQGTNFSYWISSNNTINFKFEGSVYEHFKNVSWQLLEFK